MNQKQYHSLEELPLMMNMTDVAAVLGISRAGLSFHARCFSIGWIGSVRSKNAPNGKSDLLFGCACGNRVC